MKSSEKDFLKKNKNEKNNVKKNNGGDVKSLLKGFGYAFEGIFASVKSERNLRIHLVAMVYVFVFSLFYNLSKTEYIVLIITCGLVIFSELINTSIEAISDKVSKEYDPYIKLAKDAGAGAVLVLAIMAVAVGLILFLDLKIISSIFLYFFSNKLILIFLLISFALSALFIIGKKNWREG